MSNFAYNLRKYRKREQYSQVELSRLINYGYTAIANYESGRNEPSLDVLIALAKILGVTIDELIGAEYHEEEQIFKSNFKKLSESNQKIILDLIDALLAVSP